MAFRMNCRCLPGSVHPCYSSPNGTPWEWTLYGYHADRSPTHGYGPTREAAMQAFARSWHREG
jgi:hypothetical protein